jgi:hypothetical protein
VKALALVALCGCGVLRSPNGPASTAPVLAELHREGCYGECPVYRVIVYQDGVVEYHGQYYTKVIGLRTARIDADAIKSIDTQFVGDGFRALDDYARSDCTDLPYVELTYRGKTVRHNYGDRRAPNETLTWLEGWIDYVTGSERWVGEEQALAQPLGSFCE